MRTEESMRARSPGERSSRWHAPAGSHLQWRRSAHVTVLPAAASVARSLSLSFSSNSCAAGRDRGTSERKPAKQTVPVCTCVAPSSSAFPSSLGARAPTMPFSSYSKWPAAVLAPPE